MMMMTSRFTVHAEKILHYLKEEDWVEISKIKQHASLPDEKFTPLLEFLAYSTFIDFDNERKKIRIDSNGKLLLGIQERKKMRIS